MSSCQEVLRPTFAHCFHLSVSVFSKKKRRRRRKEERWALKRSLLYWGTKRGMGHAHEKFTKNQKGL